MAKVIVADQNDEPIIERNVRSEKKTGKEFILLSGRRILVKPVSQGIYRTAGHYTF